MCINVCFIFKDLNLLVHLGLFFLLAYKAEQSIHHFQTLLFFINWLKPIALTMSHSFIASICLYNSNSIIASALWFYFTIYATQLYKVFALITFNMTQLPFIVGTLVYNNII